jgi:hypothetical protein
VAEAAENYFRRAKDSAQLYAAVEAKLGELRRFVLWWDGQEKRRGVGGSPSRTNDRDSLADFGLDRDAISRWRKRLKQPAKFDQALEAAQERCRRVCGSGHLVVVPERLVTGRENLGRVLAEVGSELACLLVSLDRGRALLESRRCFQELHRRLLAFRARVPLEPAV